ncbi:MAG: HAD hydrolase family protein [Armatimonadetes bacterium]|nr:HAD hydrolase family protein [Armatimonadota bacterium]
MPTFGRRIYGLRALRALHTTPSEGEIAIARKLICDVRELKDRQDLTFWRGAYQRFVDGLAKATFGAVLLDYDGTLCDEQDRFSGPSDEVASELTRMLQGGIVLGIATGRGNSARIDLQRVLPKQAWDNVYLGCHNGSDIGRLSEDRHPDHPETLSDSLKPTMDGLSKHPVISRFAKCKPSRNQISVRPSSAADGELVWRLVQQLAQTNGLVALRSSHSIDVLPHGVSKCLLVNHIRGLLRKGIGVLSIGDKGQWPGNDYDLLNAPHSLSVDEVSADPDTCWNLAPPGHRGVQATLDYLHRLSILPSGGARLLVGVRSRE